MNKNQPQAAARGYSAAVPGDDAAGLLPRCCGGIEAEVGSAAPPRGGRRYREDAALSPGLVDAVVDQLISSTRFSIFAEIQGR